MRVERHRPVDQPPGLGRHHLRLAGPGLAEQDDVPERVPGMRGGIVGLQRDRLAQQFAGLHELRPLQPRQQRQGAQHQLIGGGVGERPGGHALPLDQQNFGVDLGRHLRRHLVLQRQQLLQFAVEPPRPHNLVAGAQIQQPQRHPQPVRHTVDAAVDQEVDAEGAPDRRLVAGLGGEARQRTGRHQEHPAEPRQGGGDLVGEAGATDVPRTRWCR